MLPRKKLPHLRHRTHYSLKFPLYSRRPKSLLFQPTSSLQPTPLAANNLSAAFHLPQRTKHPPPRHPISSPSKFVHLQQSLVLLQATGRRFSSAAQRHRRQSTTACVLLRTATQQVAGVQ
nr:hypothetical protein Itr_chr06CG17810 [Ipomoea trifida]